MGNKVSLKVIREQIDASAALQGINSVRGDITCVVEQKLVYPYFHFTARCKVPTVVGKKEVTIACMIDGVNGHGATADHFSTDEILVPEESRLQLGISHGEATKIAQQTVTHQLGKKLKMIAPFEVALESTGLVYRSFWIVRVGDKRVMIDSVTGAMHPLAACAA
jgi:hypothetical protein